MRATDADVAVTTTVYVPAAVCGFGGTTVIVFPPHDVNTAQAMIRTKPGTSLGRRCFTMKPNATERQANRAAVGIENGLRGKTGEDETNPPAALVVATVTVTGTDVELLRFTVGGEIVQVESWGAPEQLNDTVPEKPEVPLTLRL